jgi:hypothetical protein
VLDSTNRVESSIGVMKDYKLKQRNLLASHTQTMSLVLMVYLQQIQKKAKTEGKTCHAKTMLSLEKPIKLL